jgi:hypothetical protein
LATVGNRILILERGATQINIFVISSFEEDLALEKEGKVGVRRSN